MTMRSNPTALDGITILDVTQALAGPFCTMLLGDLGAHVIKVERPGTGDQARGWGPPFQAGESAYFLSVNRNKRGLTLNLKAPEAQAILHRLVDTADVFVVNQPRIESLRAMQIDYDTLSGRNPRLIYASITGYGMDSPRAGRPGYDLLAQAESGLMSLTGEPHQAPLRYPMPLADATAGLYAALGIVTALLARTHTGHGQFLDLALLDSQTSWLTNIAGGYFATGERPQPLGNAHPNIVPYEVFHARDKAMIVAVGSERLWKAFCAALAIEETVGRDPRFATNADRLRHREELIAVLEARFAQRDAAEWLACLQAAGIPCAPINAVDEILDSEDMHARGMIVALEHPMAGWVRSLGNPTHLRGTPAAYRLPPPTLGQHTDEILGSLGYTAEAIDHLRDQAIV
jgi:crotonobetainyl-CoA:carnitine CoA-transferase CaiB-like acyl-CoA transferase